MAKKEITEEEKIDNQILDLLMKKGIKTAILDLTKNKNSYYMFTDNDQNLTENARHSINNLIKVYKIQV